MKVLITGAGGFLGRNLIETALKKTAFNMIAVTSQKEQLQELYGSESGRLSVISKEELWSMDWKEIDILLNCAFPRNVDGTKIADGLHFTLELFTKAVQGGVGAVINISSQSVYSQMRAGDATEQEEINLETKYAIGKYAVELMVNSICASVPHTNLRLASLIGPEFEQRITNKLVAQAVAGNDLQIVGGRQRFGFLDVRDAANALIAILNSNPELWDEVYNLGTNESYTLEEIAQEVCSIGYKYCNRKIQYKLIHTDKEHTVQNSSLDCTLYRKTFQWEPEFKLTDTLDWLYEKEAAFHGKNML